MSLPAPVLCYVSLAWAELNRARALFANLRRLHPDWRYVAAVSDVEPPAAVHEDFEIVAASRTGFLDMACREAREPVIVLLDPRAALTAPLDPLLARLDKADILLLARFDTPAETRQAVLSRDLHVARTGTFNIGLLALRTTGEGPVFAAWWADRTENYADDLIDPAYRDQRWCDLAPGLFDRVAIVRHMPPGLTLPFDADANAAA